MVVCTARFTIASVQAGSDSARRRQCTARAAHGETDLLRNASLQLAGTLAAAAVVLQVPAAGAAPVPLPPLQNLFATSDREQTYEFGGKQLFDPMKYAGRWYEVASLKKGFPAEGQQDCHCTSGIYEPRQMSQGIKLQVSTFCVHGGPGGRLSGIQGSVSCANPVLLELLPEFETELEREEGIVEKCSLTFDSIPFLPPEPYDVIRTDYSSFALVQGAKDRTFVQVYSRTPNPGPQFIAEKKAMLGELGYPVEEIVDTPQDCPEMSTEVMMAAMERGMRGVQLMPADTPPTTAMRGYDLGLAPAAAITATAGVTVAGGQAAGSSPVSGVQFEALRDPVQTVKDVLRLFGM